MIFINIFLLLLLFTFLLFLDYQVFFNLKEITEVVRDKSKIWALIQIVTAANFLIPGILFLSLGKEKDNKFLIGISGILLLLGYILVFGAYFHYLGLTSFFKFQVFVDLAEYLLK